MLIDHGLSGYLFAPGDSDALGDFLARLAGDADLRGRFADALYEKVERRFSLSATVAAQLEIYETVLRRHARREIRRDTVAVCGAYGRGNAGDEAILRSILQEIRELDPDVPVCVVSRNPAETKLTHRVQAIHTFHLPAFARLSRRSRLYLNGGGSLIQDVTSRRSLWFYLFTLWQAHRQKVPVVMYGCGIGPVRYRADRQLAGKVISKNVDVITLRETDSLRELESLGVSGPEIIPAADPSLTLNPHDEAAAEGIARAAGLDPAGKYAAFLLRPWPGFEEKAPAFAEAADRLSREDGLTVVFLTVDRGKDLPAARQVQKLMKEPSLLPEGKFSGEELADLLRFMSVAVSMRLHGLIFAAGRGTPLVGVVYDPKVRAFLRYIGQDLALDLDAVTADSLVAAAREARKSASPEAQQAAVARLQTLEMENRKVLRRYLGEKGGPLLS
jgi:polysaccharide pyruvyl transferase CsaB